MDTKNSQSASSVSKKDCSSSEDMTVTKSKSSALSKNRSGLFVIEDRRSVTIPKFFEDLTDVVGHCGNITKSSKDSTDKVRKRSCKCIAGVLVMSALILGAGFGLGWWYGSSNPDVQMKS